MSGSVVVQRCQFLFNRVDDISVCSGYGGLFITNYPSAQNLSVAIYKTLFQHNGIFGFCDELYFTVSIKLFEISETTLYIGDSTVSANSGLGGYFLLRNTGNTTVLFNNTVFTHNSHGGAEVRIINEIPNTRNYLEILSSNFAYNINGSLKLILIVSDLDSFTAVILNSLAMNGNVGTFGKDPTFDSDNNDQGAGILLWFSLFHAYIEISFCNVSNNDGSDGSIVYLKDHLGQDSLALNNKQILIKSLKFTGNHGSTLYLSQCSVVFQGYSSFVNNLSTKWCCNIFYSKFSSYD